MTSVESRYETLRMAALGEALPPECRSGLVLLLRRGMWGWARSWAARVQPPVLIGRQQPLHQPSESYAASPRDDEALIQVLAAMVLNANHGSPR